MIQLALNITCYGDKNIESEKVLKVLHPKPISLRKYDIVLVRQTFQVIILWSNRLGIFLQSSLSIILNNRVIF